MLFGINNHIDESFNADASSNDDGVVMKIEVRCSTENHQFLKNLFQTCMMFNVKYLVIFLRKVYKKHNDSEIILHIFRIFLRIKQNTVFVNSSIYEQNKNN